MSAQDLLIEIGTEELPPKTLRDLSQAFLSGVTAELAAAGLAHGTTQAFATPRRLAVLVRELPVSQPDSEMRRKGPPAKAAFDAAGAPTIAAEKFAASCGVGIDALTRVQEEKGEFLYFIGTRQGAPTRELVPAMVEKSLATLPIARRMRWGSGEASFVRPVHWVVLLFGTEVISARVLDVTAGGATRGHRFHAPAPIAIGRPGNYVALLREKGKVLADFAARREQIAASVRKLAHDLGGGAIMPDELLDEVTALTEWPVPIAGRFPERFLALPQEVLLSTLNDHQRYFAVIGKDTALTNAFIAVANIDSREPASVREGNERVVLPRLADAEFFHSQDRKQGLAQMAKGLANVTFKAGLGSLADRTARITALAGKIAAALGADRTAAERAARLAKCDLLSAMVGEFPELQGIMGAHYAQADGEPAAVVGGIRDQYLPKGPADRLPSSTEAAAVAIADKLDNLAGIFALGEKPTGTRDPFGLRRAAIGLLRILIEKGLDLDLKRMIELAVALQPVKREGTAREVQDYVDERLRGYYLEGSESRVTTEMIDAVLAVEIASPLDFDRRLRALGAFLARPEAATLAAANKRIGNILRKSGDTAAGAVDSQLLREAAERDLYQALTRRSARVREASRDGRYADALETLAELGPAIDGFFDKVMVMDPDAALRDNRLRLLGQLREAFAQVADLSRLPG
ncbi:MAG: glycine--tRNA ligase subunit beta [Steroidobacteraceae bacterium]